MFHNIGHRRKNKLNLSLSKHILWNISIVCSCFHPQLGVNGYALVIDNNGHVLFHPKLKTAVGEQSMSGLCVSTMWKLVRPNNVQGVPNYMKSI